MLTRAGVAKRLGRSVATVRRMEGIELHPWVDERGVHQFDAGEVDAVKARDAEHAAPTPVLAVDAEPLLADALEALSAANQELLDLRERLSDSEASRSRSAKLAGLVERENLELRAAAIEALGMVETLLGGATPYVVRSVIRDLRSAG